MTNLKTNTFPAALAGAISLFLAPAFYYTSKIQNMNQAHILKRAGAFILSFADLPFLAFYFFIFWLLLSILIIAFTHFKSGSNNLKYLNQNTFKLKNQITLPRRLYLAAAMFVAWLPFLLVFYPGPGMNDTMNIFYGGIGRIGQFPWAYTIILSTLGRLSLNLLGSRMPTIFMLALIQMGVMAAGLSYCVKRVAQITNNSSFGWILQLFYMFFPMVGNYAIAVVRDPLFSLAMTLWVLFLIDYLFSNTIWTRSTYIKLLLLLLSTMMLRSNAPIVMMVLIIALIWGKSREIQKKIVITFILSLAIAILPGRVIMQYKHIEPLFQESMAMPIQQVARTFALSGKLEPQDKEIMSHYFSLSQWKNNYDPFNVDHIKWNKNFNRKRLNKEKFSFLKSWARIGIHNPRLYVEAWMLTSYWNWNTKFLNPNHQSRFGWALDDTQSNRQDLMNNFMSPGKLAIPDKLKNTLAHWQFDYSRFLGAGICFWITCVIAGLFLTVREYNYAFAMLPLLVNSMTLLVSTPVSSVYRYSFSYVLVLPLIFLILLNHLYKKGN